MKRYRPTITTLILPDGTLIDFPGREAYDDDISNPIQEAARKRHNRTAREKRAALKRLEQLKRYEHWRPPSYWDMRGDDD